MHFRVLHKISFINDQLSKMGFKENATCSVCNERRDSNEHMLLFCRESISVPSISVNGEIVKILNIPIGNLGSVFDPSMNMAAHVSKAVKSANYYLRNIGRIRKYLTAESSKTAVISLVTSRFDYCNGLLCGIPEELIHKLQRV